MASTFSIPFKGDATALIEKVRRQVQQNDGTLTGDSRAGSFSGSGVEGRYRITGQTAEVTIDHSPMFVPMSLIESKLREFFT